MFGRGGDQNGAIQILQTSVCIETKKAWTKISEQGQTHTAPDSIFYKKFLYKNGSFVAVDKFLGSVTSFIYL